MLDFWTVALAVLLATLLPAYVGIYVMYTVGRKRVGYASSFALGVLLWSFIDIMGDSSYLGVNQGFGGGLAHVSLVLLFFVGLFVLVLPDLSGFGNGEATEAAGLVPFLMALGWAFHSFGEGVDVGSFALTYSGISIVEAFGGYWPGVSFVLHKVLEGSTLGVALLAYHPTVPRRDTLRVIGLGLLFGLPTLLGSIAGYLAGVNSTYFFALGGGAVIYILLKLARVTLGAEPASRNYYIACTVSVALGFASLYAAALFHSIT